MVIILEKNGVLNSIFREYLIKKGKKNEFRYKIFYCINMVETEYEN